MKLSRPTTALWTRRTPCRLDWRRHFPPCRKLHRSIKSSRRPDWLRHHRRRKYAGRKSSSHWLSRRTLCHSRWRRHTSPCHTACCRTRPIPQISLPTPEFNAFRPKNHVPGQHDSFFIWWLSRVVRNENSNVKARNSKGATDAPVTKIK